MSRVRIIFPEKPPVFQTEMAIRVSDINYGNHLSNDAVLAISQEARLQFLNANGYSELDVGNGCGIIMADAAVAYKNEGHYGDRLIIELYLDELTASSIDILYRIYTQRDHTEKDIAHVKTGIVCFNYQTRKIDKWSTEFLNKLSL